MKCETCKHNNKKDWNYDNDEDFGYCTKYDKIICYRCMLDVECEDYEEENNELQ